MDMPLSFRRVQRVRHELRRRDVVVTAVESPSPGFAAVTFGGESLAGFTSLSFDDHVKFIVETAGGEPLMRDYTPRRFDAVQRTLTLEFALHGHGPAAEWARGARVGDAAVIGGPRGSMIVPADYDWHLLAGDASALPAIARRLEELPATTRAIVLLELPDAADRRALRSAAPLALHWAADTAAWLHALRTLPLPAGSGYAWCAGEAQAIAMARRILLEERGHPRADAKIAAYWKRGEADFHAPKEG